MCYAAFLLELRQTIALANKTIIFTADQFLPENGQLTKNGLEW
jgi:hypothetical protein